MPKGIRNTQPTPPIKAEPIAPAPVAKPVAKPTPLIMLQPHGDGFQFNS